MDGHRERSLGVPVVRGDVHGDVGWLRWNFQTETSVAAPGSKIIDELERIEAGDGNRTRMATLGSW
jgi:hypothetical protein